MEKNRLRSTYKKQLQAIHEGKCKRLYLIWMIRAICGGILPVITLFYTKIIIEVITYDTDPALLIQKVILLTLICIIFYGIDCLLEGYSQALIFLLRTKEFSRNARMYHDVDYKKMEDSKFLDDMEIGFQALENDSEGWQNVFTLTGKLCIQIVTAVLLLILLGSFEIKIAMISLINLIIMFYVHQKISDYEHSCEEQEAHAQRQNNYFSLTSCDFEYGKDIRVFQLKDILMRKFNETSKNYVQIIKGIEDYKFRVGFIEVVLLLILNGYIYYSIVVGYFNQVIDFSQVSLYVSASVAFTALTRTFSDNLSKMLKDLKLSSTYYKVIEENNSSTKYGSKQALSQNEPLEFEFKNVSFRYPGCEKFVLKNFNFKIAAGEKLAIVGTNGAGKSTIVKLMCGLFDPSEGELLVNGINVKEFDREEYYQMFSVVFQDFEIYAGTILENVIGNDQGNEAIERGKLCLDKVGLTDKILSLPKKYDTPLLKILDENGIDLSGGQKQKLAIARGLYKNGNTVILDEPTSALDALAEAEIYQSFDELVKDKTAIYISHRLSSTKFCDRIAFFDENGLQEVGSHDELMANKKGYYKMFEIQGQYYRQEECSDESIY